MNEQKEILESLKSNPFKMPDGYLENLESSLQEKINTSCEERKGWRQVMRPVLYMAAMFGLIFGMCYGVMHLTHTSNDLKDYQITSGVAEINHGFLKSSFIEYLDEEALEDENVTLSNDDIITYLDDVISYNQLETYLAQE